MTDIPAYNEKEISMKDISFCYKSDRRGSNPRSRPWQGRALPTTPLSHKRVMGIEPTYPAWKAGVLPLNYTRIGIFNLLYNAQFRNRTRDTRIFSPLLYQLS